MTSFEQSVLNITSKIPKGKVLTYGAIARMLKKPGASRAVGNALNKNPNAPKVPCHRVIRSDGSTGGYAFGPGRKTELLRKEGIEVRNKKVDLKKYLFDN